MAQDLNIVDESKLATPALPSEDSTLKHAAVVVVVMAVLYYASAVIVPVILAVLITYALEPIVRQLSRLRVPRWLAAMSTIVALYAAVGFTAFSLRDKATGVIASLPDAMQKLRTTIEKRRAASNPEEPVTQIQEAAKEIQKTASSVASTEQPAPKNVTRVQIEPPSFNVQNYLWSGTMGFLGLIGQAFVLTFLVYFLLASGDLYRRKTVRIVGNSFWQKRLTLEVIQEINSQIERFLLVQLFTSAVVSLATWLLLAVMGVENAVVWALVAGVLNSVPYFGAIAVSAGLALVAFLQFGTLLATIEIAGGAFLITSLEGMILTPALMGKTAGINQVAMFVSLLFWGWMWGVMGTLLAVPIMMMIKTICEHVDGLEKYGEFLNEH